MQTSEIFRVYSYNTTFATTSCGRIGTRSKLPSEFMILGDVHSQRGGKEYNNLKARLKLVKFIDVVSSGGIYRMAVFKADSIRPAPARNVRDASKGR